MAIFWDPIKQVTVKKFASILDDRSSENYNQAEALAWHLLGEGSSVSASPEILFEDLATGF